MAGSTVGSILAADFGSVWTRVTLFDVVDGEYRMIARGNGLTTLGDPIDDLQVGLRRVVEEIEQVTGRKIYDHLGRVMTPEDQNRQGVDLFITTTSAGRPMRAVIIGLVPEVSIAAALRSISSSYVEAVAQIHLHDGRSEEERLNALVLSRPDVLIITGGTEGGATSGLTELLETISLAFSMLDRELRPIVLYAGNSQLRERVEEMFGSLTDLFIAENLSPDIGTDALLDAQAKLADSYDEYRETQGEAFQALAQMSSSGLMPAAQSYGVVTDYFGRTRDINVIAVDMGSTSSVQAGYFNGEGHIRISTTGGLGHSAVTLLDEVGEYAVASWLPFYPKADEIRNYALNKAIRPVGIPMSQRDLYLEHALLRAGLRRMTARSRELWTGVSDDYSPLPPVDLVIAGGSALTNTGSAGYTMMLVADTVQPSGVTQIKSDPDGIIPVVGVLAQYSPEAAVHLLDSDAQLKMLGTLVSFDGRPEFEQTVARLKITTEDGEVIQHDLKGGHLLSLPLPEGFNLQVQIQCRGRFRVGGKRRLKLSLAGGEGGVLFDARGRPFTTPATVEARVQRLPQWIHEATDDPLVTLPEDWLRPPSERAKPMSIDDELKNLDGGDFSEDNETKSKAKAEPEAADLDDLFAEFDDEAENAQRPKKDDDDDDDFSSLRNLLD